MRRTMSVLAIALLALAACEKSKGTSEEAPIKKGSTPQPLPPPPIDAAPVPLDAPVGGGGDGDAAVADPHGDHGEAPAVPGSTAPTPAPVGGSADNSVRPPVAADLPIYLKAVAGKGSLRADIVTSMGTFHCALFEKEAPITVANFVGLATGQKPWEKVDTKKVMTNTPFYNGLIFHRVIPGFMIQGGDPLFNGTGGPGYNFADEIAPSLKMDRAGLLAMANAGPGPTGGGTNGSQFFITEAGATWLTGKHTIFGSCDEVDLVKKITAVPKGPGDRPVTPVTITKVAILRK
mgnify:CR=1 FL=1